MYCYRKPVLASWDDKYTNDSRTIHAGVLQKYVAWLHVRIALWTSQGSHGHTLFLRWYALVVFQTGMEKLLRSFAFQPISNGCKYRSHSASTVLIQQVPFSGLYFAEQVPSLQIRITVLFSADLQTPRRALPGFPATLPVLQNVSTHFYYPYAHSVIASFTRCRHNHRKLITYRATLPPYWENGTWQVPSQLSHSVQWKFNWNSNLFIRDNLFPITIYKMSKQERLKCRNTLGCLDQYAAQNNKYARPPIPSQPPTQKVFQWHTQYPTMKLSHCDTSLCQGAVPMAVLWIGSLPPNSLNSPNFQTSWSH